jgi:ferric-dicitrate binding protein FerR (iron transport regulator)
MTRSGEDTVRSEDDAVEALLRQAAPRLLPPAEDERLVREEVFAAWQAVVGRRKRRRRAGYVAIAASVLLALAATLDVFRVTGDIAPDVATIGKQHGSIYLLDDQSAMLALGDRTSIAAGQTLVTAGGAGIGLTWHNGNGSLRIDENTRIELLSNDAVFLRSGRLYFDSGVVNLAGASVSAAGQLKVETDLGTVTHLGTQYMAAVDGASLTVSVREGEIEVDGRYIAREGEQLQRHGTAAPSIANIGSSGSAWAWTEAVSPRMEIDGKSTFEFLQWVARETGLELIFASSEAESMARAGRLMGTIDTAPREALETWMAGELLTATIEGQTIIVSLIAQEG